MLRIAGTQMAERKMTWEAARRLITSDGQWKYDVTPSETAGQNAAIGRTDNKGAKEFWHYDVSRGKNYFLRSSGFSRKSTWFTSGKLTGRRRSIIDMINGEEIRSRKWNYDESGKLLRMMDSAKDNPELQRKLLTLIRQ